MNLKQAKEKLRSVQLRCETRLISNQDLDEIESLYQKLKKAHPQASSLIVVSSGRDHDYPRRSKATRVRRTKENGFEIHRIKEHYLDDVRHRISAYVRYERTHNSPKVEGMESYATSRSHHYYILRNAEDPSLSF